jgi:hypothetical protein
MGKVRQMHEALLIEMLATRELRSLEFVVRKGISRLFMSPRAGGGESG